MNLFKTAVLQEPPGVTSHKNVILTAVQTGVNLKMNALTNVALTTQQKHGVKLMDNAMTNVVAAHLDQRNVVVLLETPPLITSAIFQTQKTAALISGVLNVVV